MNSKIIVKSKEGGYNTPGSIIVSMGTIRKKISAVVFSEKEAVRLRMHIDKFSQSK